MGYPATWEELRKLRSTHLKRDSLINFVEGTEVKYHPEHHGYTDNMYQKNKDTVFIVMKKRIFTKKASGLTDGDIRIYEPISGNSRVVNYKKLIIIKHKQ